MSDGFHGETDVRRIQSCVWNPLDHESSLSTFLVGPVSGRCVSKKDRVLLLSGSSKPIDAGRNIIKNFHIPSRKCGGYPHRCLCFPHHRVQPLWVHHLLSLHEKG